MSKIESGNIQFESIPFNLQVSFKISADKPALITWFASQDLVHTLVRVERPNAQSKGLQLHESLVRAGVR